MATGNMQRKIGEMCTCVFEICEIDTLIAVLCPPTGVAVTHYQGPRKLSKSGAASWGPKGRISRPEGPRAGMGFLGRGQQAPSPPARGSGGALWAPPAGPGAEPQPKLNVVNFSLKIRHLVATKLMIFLKINLSSCCGKIAYLPPQFKKWGGIGRPCSIGSAVFGFWFGHNERLPSLGLASVGQKLWWRGRRSLACRSLGCCFEGRGTVASHTIDEVEKVQEPQCKGPSGYYAHCNHKWDKAKGPSRNMPKGPQMISDATASISNIQHANDFCGFPRWHSNTKKPTRRQVYS